MRPEFFDEIVPHALPASPRAWTYVSGVAELACAVAVARPPTRRAGGLAAAVLFVAVFPANIQMAVDWRTRPARDRAAAYGRLPLQLPLVLWGAQGSEGCISMSKSWQKTTVAELVPGDRVGSGTTSSTWRASSRRSSARPRSCA